MPPLCCQQPAYTIFYMATKPTLAGRLTWGELVPGGVAPRSASCPSTLISMLR